MPRLLLTLFACACLALPVRADDDPARALARRVAEAAGLGAWSEVGTISFAFVFAAKNIERRYVWHVREGRVDVVEDGHTVTVSVSGADLVDKAQIEAHQRFVNDSFWALPCFHLVWDAGTTLEDLGEVDVPGLPDLGKRRALSLAYDPNGGGYTPGDRYVFYLGDDDYPVAWAYHRNGAAEARFVAEWRSPREVGGVKVVEQYWALAGALNLQIQDVEVAPAEGEAAPTSRPAAPAEGEGSTSRPSAPPTSRPAGD